MNVIIICIGPEGLGDGGEEKKGQNVGIFFFCHPLVHFEKATIDPDFALKGRTPAKVGDNQGPKGAGVRETKRHEVVQVLNEKAAETVFNYAIG